MSRNVVIIGAMDDLIAIVSDFRQRLENLELDYGLSLQSFPNGACCDASILLAHHLSLNGFGSFRYMEGSHGEASHVWLWNGEIIIDITADQFDGFHSTVFVAPTSEWHDNCDGVDKQEAVITIWGREVGDRFLAAYHALMKAAP